MELTLITGNKNKVREFSQILGDDFTINNVKIELEEIQSTDVRKVVGHKLQQAYSILKKPLLVEDTGIHIKSLNGFPGALVKSFWEHLGNKGICQIAGLSPIHALTIIGYHDGEKMYFFQGNSEGEIPQIPTEGGFGWDGIFVPKGYNKSYGQMTPEEKNKISQRSKALDELKKFFQK
tara:strand:- start:138 stop:671 length:534 start_codon:yes stop_codon:yes gene_type:complete